MRAPRSLRHEYAQQLRIAELKDDKQKRHEAHMFAPCQPPPCHNMTRKHTEPNVMTWLLEPIEILWRESLRQDAKEKQALLDLPGP